jgi:hypothetical protein
MKSTFDLDRLQKVADYHGARQTLRTGAIGSMIFGAIGLALAIVPPYEPVLGVVGAMLLGTGTWNSTRPRPAGIVIDGLTLILVGVYNVLGAFGAGVTVWAKLGIFQIVWGVQSISRYAQFRVALSEVPEAVELQQFQELAQAIRKAKTKESPDLLEFTTTGWHAKRWKARLTERAAIIACVGSHETHVVARERLEVTTQGKVMIGRDLKATITWGGKPHRGTMSPEGFERYQVWKGEAVLPQPIAA